MNNDHRSVVEVTNRGDEGVGGKVHLEVRLAEPCEGHRVVARQHDVGMPDLMAEADKGHRDDLL